MTKINYRRSRKDARKSLTSASRQKIAYQAAKLMVSGNAQNYENAKQKAAKQLGIRLEGPFPSNSEIEETIFLHQKLFQPDEHNKRIEILRLLAKRAMQLFLEFSPRLVGPVHQGIVTSHTIVNLLLFAEATESIDLFLIEKRIPYELGLKTMTLPDGKIQQFPSYLIRDQNEQVEIIVLPTDMRKKLPIRAKGNSLLYRGMGLEDY